MVMTVTVTTTITMTATTPVTMAAVLSGSAASVAILSGGVSALWITKCVDGYGTAAVHIQTQTLYSNGGLCMSGKQKLPNMLSAVSLLLGLYHEVLLEMSPAALSLENTGMHCQ